MAQQTLLASACKRKYDHEETEQEENGQQSANCSSKSRASDQPLSKRRSRFTMEEGIKVCICGGGNAAHVMAGLAAAHPKKPEVRVLSLYQSEAEDWSNKLKEEDMVVCRHHPNGEEEEIKSKPTLVTKDPGQAVTGADVIIFCVPAFAHQQYFEAIAGHVAEHTAIIGLPGQPGFEFQCFHSLKDKAQSCVVLNYETLPWACRIAEFGRKVDLLATKVALTGSKVSGKVSRPKGEPVQVLQSLLGGKPELKEANNYLELLLMSMTFSHPPIMYGQWKDWDGKPLSEKPLFYQGLSEYAANVMMEVSDEVMDLAKVIEAKSGVKMSCMQSACEWLMETYAHTIEDKTNFYTAMRTNRGYDGLVHPMKEVTPGSGQYVPDFQYRYLSEDIPFGLAVVKGVAQMAGKDTPSMDRVLTWAQGHLGREFMQGSELKGKDVKVTRAPQAFGFNCLEDLLALM